MKSFGTGLILIFLLVSCSQKYSESDLHGAWSVKEWTVESSGKTVSNKMDMNFEVDGQYAIDYGSKKENGKYWINGEYLHTVAEGKSEMSVRILDLKTDSLVMQMNRGGELEKVLLLRK